MSKTAILGGSTASARSQIGGDLSDGYQWWPAVTTYCLRDVEVWRRFSHITERRHRSSCQSRKSCLAEEHYQEISKKKGKKKSRTKRIESEISSCRRIAVSQMIDRRASLDGQSQDSMGTEGRRRSTLTSLRPCASTTFSSAGVCQFACPYAEALP